MLRHSSLIVLSMIGWNNIKNFESKLFFTLSSGSEFLVLSIITNQFIMTLQVYDGVTE